MSNAVYYCSNCGFEVTAEQSICPSCGLELENQIPSDEEAFTTVVKTFDSLIDANVAKDILLEEGIESILSDTNRDSAYPSSLFNNPVYLYVLEKDFVKAYEILDSYEKAKPIE